MITIEPPSKTAASPGTALSKAGLARFLNRARAAVGIEGEVHVLLADDATLRRLNRTFRGKNKATDVLSFPAEKKRWASRSRRKKSYKEGADNTGGAEKSRAKQESRPAERYLGDIAIAPETARRYAKKNGRSLGHELRVLILHGVLHLLGYDHETDRGEMDRIERKVRRRFGLS